MTAVDTVRDPASLECPYVGLTSYTQENAPFFFGRDAERRVLISNLRVSRLTLLYAQSGAGKSSLLRAGVAARLVELAGRSLDQRRPARNIPIVFSSWRDDPTEELIEAVQQTTIAFRPEAVSTKSTETRPNVAFDVPRTVSDVTLPYRRPTGPSGPTRTRLSGTLKAASKAADATLLVMLDQFEEYFLYRSKEAQDGHFADELAACINQADLRVHFLIAIREDAYWGLGNLFKSRIANVYGNYLHLENLTRESARQAIEMPVASFNKLHPHSVPVEIEPGLVDVVLDELRPGQFALDSGGQGRVSGANGDRRHSGEIAAPYLQLVMQRLWETELPNSRRLRRKTLEDLGGAQTIVRTHVDRALGGLPEEAREAAVDIFHHLVTPSGTKIALAASDLAEYTGRPAEEAGALLERLAGSDTRIVRPIPPPPGQQGGTRYEISHDLLARAILDWGGRQRAVRLEHEKESAEREVRVEKRRARTFRGLALGAAALLVVAIVLWVAAVNSRHQVESLAIAARAESVLGQDPEMSARLALRALNVSSTAQAQTALRDALPQMQLKATLAPAPPVRSAAFSADGTKILTAAADGRIRIFDAANGTQLAAFAGFAGVGTLNSAAFSRDGTRIVTANDDGTARILDASSGKVTRVLTPPGSNGYAVSSAAFSPDGKLIIASYADGTARIWDARSGRQIRALTAEQGKNVLVDGAFSADGKRVVIASDGGAARIYDARTGAQIRALPGKFALESAAFSPDGKFVVTAARDGTARIWAVSTGKLAATLTPPSYRYNRYVVFSAAFSPDGQHVVTAGGDGVARIWDAASGRLVRVLGTAGSDSLQAAAYSPDGTSIVTASAGGLVRIWDANTGGQARLLADAGGVSPLRSAVFSPDGKWAATGGRFGTVTIWKAPAAGSRSSSWTVRNVISIPEGDAVNGMAFSQNGKQLVTANQSGTAYVWQVPTGQTWQEFREGYGQPLNTVAFDPAHQNWVVTAGDDGYARIFKISDGTQVGSRFGVAGRPMNAANFAPNGTLIVTAGSDGYARLWDTPTHLQHGPKFGYGSPMSSAAINGGGTRLVTTEADGYTVIWNCTTFPPTASAFIRAPGNSVPHDAAFSRDGALIVTAGSDGTVREWDTATGNQVLVLGSSSGLISTVAFRGSEVITASSDGTAKIWDAQPVEQRGLLPSSKGQQVYTSTFSPANPRIVATANGNGTVSVWNSSRPAHPMATLHVPGAASAEFSADGKLLVTAGNEQVQIWRMSSLGHPVRVLDTKPCENRSNNAARFLDSAVFSRDGRLVVTSENDGTACVWNAGTGQLMRRFIEPQGVSGGVAGGLGVASSAMRWAVFSPNGKQVLTANADGTARIWDVKTGQQLRVVSEPTGEAINAARFSPDGKLLLTASDDGTGRIWDATSGKLLQTLRGPELTPVYNAVFSHDGNQVVSCSGSTAVIWSSAGQQLTEFQGRSLKDCEFSPDGRQVATAGGDGYTRIFSTELAGNLTQVEQIARQRLHLTSQAPAQCRPIGVC